jgi:hypothetical protein
MCPCHRVITGAGTDERLLGGIATSQGRIAGERSRLRRKSGDPDHLSPLADGASSPRRVRRRPRRLSRRPQREAAVELREYGTTEGDHRATPPIGQPAIMPEPGEAGICIKASYLPLNHGFRPREHPPYNTHSLQVIGDSFGVFFFVYTTLSGELA